MGSSAAVSAATGRARRRLDELQQLHGHWKEAHRFAQTMPEREYSGARAGHWGLSISIMTSTINDMYTLAEGIYSI